MFYLNAFLHKDGASQDLPPYTILQGKVVYYNLHCKVAFGSYAQTRNLTTSDMNARTTGAIAMGPSTNFQSGVEFYSLKLAKTLNRSRNDYTLTLMPADAILRVTRLAKDMPNG